MQIQSSNEFYDLILHLLDYILIEAKIFNSWNVWISQAQKRIQYPSS